MNYINGQWVKGHGTPFSSINPADGSVVWSGYLSADQDIQLAAQAAHESLPAWVTAGAEKRISHLQAFAAQVQARRESLTQLIAIETGKPLWEAATETSAVIAKTNLSIEAWKERMAETQTATADANACLRYKPHGVVVVLGAFNFPAHLSNGHIIPALLAGNTIIYKPSELTPAVAQFVMQCWHDSGLPNGVLNCVQGDGLTGQLLLAGDIQGVFFTGSHKTGQRIHKFFSEKPEIILALEMGGNNPLIVADVANTDAAVYQTIVSSFITAGQRCTCARRLLVEDSAQGRLFLQRLISVCKTIKTGIFSQQPQPFMGPVISAAHARSHLHTQQTLMDSGGVPLLTMSSLNDQTGLLSPGIMDMTQATNPPDEEIFAPFLQVYHYQDFEQALALANNTRYGLSAGLLSDNRELYERFWQNIRAGLVNWNRPTTGALGSLPFGGIGYSGNHRPSAWFAADYCAYPVAGLEQPSLTRPEQLLPGITLE